LILEFKDLTKKFGTRTVLNSISFSIEKGEIVFILGQSGTGKSVLLKTLVGLLKPDGGQIFLEGVNIAKFTEKQMQNIRKKCGMVFQQPALFDSLSIYENLAYGMRRHFKFSEPLIREKIQKALKSVHLEEGILEKSPQQVSYGMQKRISLARTLVLEPEILLFDEPTTGLDPVTTTAINKLIKEVSVQYKTTSIVVSHDMKCAMEIADRVIFLDKGSVIFSGATSEVKSSEHPLVRDFFLEVSR
jgi:phospholipid/cholesterol/gamma-HCH transport system ATP-binding protein